MIGAFFSLFGIIPIGQWYFADPSFRTPILPSFVQPWAIGGLFPPPGPPSAKYLAEVLAATNRTPGDRIVSTRLERQKISAPRQFRGIGRASLWEVSYLVEVIGPDGPYSIYVDRSALVLVP